MSVSQSVCHMKRVERSTDRSPPPIFTKLATKVESREIWLPIVLVEIQKTHVCQTGSGINFRQCSYGKIALMSNISKTVTDTMMWSVEVEYETNPGLSIGTMTFDLGWPWTFPYVSQNLNIKYLECR